MKNLFPFRFAFIFGIFLAPLAFANAASITIQSIAPGTSVSANNKITFSITASGFYPQFYQLSDSFGSSTVSVNDITSAGNFSWVPQLVDVGTHTLSITANDGSGNAASTTQTITVQSAPSLTIQSVSPGNTIMPGTKFTFSVSAAGFINPFYIAGDSFSGSSVGDPNIGSSGNFSWTPDMTQNGTHTITIYASDSLGHSASISQNVQVGAGPTLIIQSLSPSSSVSPGQTVSFTAIGSNYSPTTFSVRDSFSGTTIVSSDLSTSGSFSWVPQTSDAGTHILTVTGTVGSYGQSTSTTQTLLVFGPNSSTTTQPVIPTATSSQPIIPSPISSAHAFTFNSYLYSGLQNSDVVQLQTLLSKEGYFSGTISGYFGPVTAAAVKKFQAAEGLAQLGIVGPATRAALNVALVNPQTATTTISASTTAAYVFQNFIGFGQQSTDVIELQKRLLSLGFFSGAATGYFGRTTEAAVKLFQGAHGIRAAGYVGPGTRAALNQ